MVANVAQRWGQLQGWFVIADKPKLLWRTLEWALALAWPFVAYQVVSNRYGWKSEYYNKWSEGWFALALLIPMVAPVLVRLFSGSSLDAQKRCVLAATMVIGVALAIKFRPHFGGLTFMGFIVPVALYGLAAFLWLGWRNKKFLPGTGSRKKPTSHAQPARASVVENAH